MIVKKTDAFDKWLDKLRDSRAKAIILSHIMRMEDGNLGKVESVGDGVYEKKIEYGPGYRIYFSRAGNALIILLCGGDKSRQPKDIISAKKMLGRCLNGE